MWFCHSASPYGCRVGKSLMSKPDLSEPRNLRHLAARQEAIRDPPLIQYFDGA